MNAANEHVFSHGMRDTRQTFEAWNERPWAVLHGWVALSLAIALALLGAVWVVAGVLTPDITPIDMAGITESTSPADMLPILWRNSLVLALHGTACVCASRGSSTASLRSASRSKSQEERGKVLL